MVYKENRVHRNCLKMEKMWFLTVFWNSFQKSISLKPNSLENALEFYSEENWILWLLSSSKQSHATKGETFFWTRIHILCMDVVVLFMSYLSCRDRMWGLLQGQFFLTGTRRVYSSKHSNFLVLFFCYFFEMLRGFLPIYWWKGNST